MPPMYEYQCDDCDLISTEFRSYEERDLGGQCDLCHNPLKRVFNSAPAQLNIALPDGTKRRGFSDLKEAAKLEADAMDSRPAERKKITAEVIKLRELK